MSYREEINNIYKYEGLYGFTRGYSAMLIVEIPTCGFYFCSYEFFKKLFRVSREYVDSEEFNFSVVFRKFLAGGINGMISWTIIYPLDCIRSAMFTARDTRLSFYETGKRIVQESGVKRLFQGV